MTQWMPSMLAVSALGFGCASITVPATDDPIELAVANRQRSDADRDRDQTSKPIEVLHFAGVRPGMRVLDLLSGGGYYSEILSYVVGPEGIVVAHTNDIYEEYHKSEISERYRQNRLPNVVRLISNPPELQLESESFDVVFLVLAYHDVYYVSESNPKHPEIDRNRFFQQLHDCLKQGGTLVIVDHAAKSGTGKDAAQDLHRIDEEFARRDIELAGFKFVSETDVLRNPDDDRSISVFDDRVRWRTDRFVFRFEK
jgi:predicted methyltransferase